MSEWINIKDKLPPIGKKIIITTPANSFSIMTLGYAWKHEDEKGFPMVATEDTIRCVDAYWMLIPPLPDLPK